MRANRLAVVALGLVVVLAGCSGSPGGPGTESPANGTDTAGTATVQYPAGATQSGIENASALVAATNRRLQTTDHAITQVLEQRSGGESLTVTQRAWSSLDEKRRRFVFDATSETNRLFVANGTQYYTGRTDGETTTRSAPLDRPFAALHGPEMLGGGESLGGILRNGNFSATGTVQRDGRTLVRYELVEPNRHRISGTVTGASGELLVGSDGVVYDASLRLDFENGHLNQTFRIDELGDVTVQRPDWVDQFADTG